MYNHNQRLMRWALLAQGYNLEIKQKKGTDNVVADALSRATGNQVDCLKAAEGYSRKRAYILLRPQSGVSSLISCHFAGLPNVIGCIDGTQIPITAPTQNEGDYVNRKSFHSINVQIICDATSLITNVEAKWPGSVHDSRIYRECSLSNRFARGEFDGYLLGDRGYPCQPSLLTPYPDPEPGPQQRFNVAHCRTRARVEMTIGILKSRFQCLRKLRVTPERACDIIVACVVLHNIAIIRGEQHPAVQINDAEDDHPIPADVQDGRAVRDLIARNHF
ncbi:putative nuclease HARBI1 [Solea solea]|uniref:putative nuclease HARBI1 n=1 Tax=Solea solea TaxID=90069 RepID=UPI00272CF56D|nr:putative nuclease HARBI1 [Solea solea]